MAEFTCSECGKCFKQSSTNGHNHIKDKYNQPNPAVWDAQTDECTHRKHRAPKTQVDPSSSARKLPYATVVKLEPIYAMDGNVTAGCGTSGYGHAHSKKGQAASSTPTTMPPSKKRKELPTVPFSPPTSPRSPPALVSTSSGSSSPSMSSLCSSSSLEAQLPPLPLSPSAPFYGGLYSAGSAPLDGGDRKRGRLSTVEYDNFPTSAFVLPRSFTYDGTASLLSDADVERSEAAWAAKLKWWDEQPDEEASYEAEDMYGL